MPFYGVENVRLCSQYLKHCSNLISHNHTLTLHLNIVQTNSIIDYFDNATVS